MNFWQNEKIRLRGIEPQDAEFFTEMNEDSEMGRYMDFLWPPTSREGSRVSCQEASKKKFEGDTFHWIIESPDGTPVGTIDTHSCNPRLGTFGFGVAIMEKHKRKGYAREAIQMVLNYYFEELNYQKVTVEVHSDNMASLKLHESLGFQREGILRRMGFTKGRFIDHHYFGLTAEEFDAAQ